METQSPGLFFAGHYRDGISLSDSIVSGCNASDRAQFFVARSAAGLTMRAADLAIADSI
jgi:hypothetical protein